MTNSLFDKHLNDLDGEVASSTAPPYGARGGDGASLMEGRAPPGSDAEPLPDLSSAELKNGAGRAKWNDDPKKRIAMRMASRGILGAAFFTIGGSLGNKWLNGELHQKAYNPNAGWGEALPFTPEGNPAKFMAKLIDTVVGRPIEATVHAITGSKTLATQAVRFRPTKFEGFTRDGDLVRGRTLGHEMFAVTFDFFLMSIGDAMGQDILGWFDPGVKQKWMKNGTVNPPEALKSLGKSMWRYVSYNGGEDWAVALPYVYYMKGQRSLINHFSPGFKYDFDHGMNGGSFKVDKNGRITGNYTQEGSFDLQGRFTFYNICTLMYREVYNYLENKIQGKPGRLYGAPDSEEKRGVLGTVADLGKWGVRSAIKGSIYMTASVPFFWITRTTQKQQNGLLIKGNEGFLGYKNANGMLAAIGASDQFRNANKPSALKSDQTVAYVPFTGTIPVGANPLAKGAKNFRLNPTYDEKKFHPFGTGGLNASASLDKKFFDGIGHYNYQASQLLDKPAKWFDTTFPGLTNPLKKAFGMPDKLSATTRGIVNAFVAYTPYMIAKRETSLLWDDGKMDMATERLIDGATRLNWKQFTGGAGEMLSSFLHRPLADPVREAEGQRRKVIDQSLPDDLRNDGGEMSAPKDMASWQSRTAHAPARHESRTEKSTVAYSDMAPQKAKGYTDQESRRKTYTAPAAAV